MKISSRLDGEWSSSCLTWSSTIGLTMLNYLARHPCVILLSYLPLPRVTRTSCFLSSGSATRLPVKSNSVSHSTPTSTSSLSDPESDSEDSTSDDERNTFEDIEESDEARQGEPAENEQQEAAVASDANSSNLSYLNTTATHQPLKSGERRDLPLSSHNVSDGDLVSQQFSYIPQGFCKEVVSLFCCSSAQCGLYYTV